MNPPRLMTSRRLSKISTTLSLPAAVKQIAPLHCSLILCTKAMTARPGLNSLTLVSLVDLLHSLTLSIIDHLLVLQLRRTLMPVAMWTVIPTAVRPLLSLSQRPLCIPNLLRSPDSSRMLLSKAERILCSLQLQCKICHLLFLHFHLCARCYRPHLLVY